tara:strand:- start:939 stop:1142 length:204 start_codon:yes stop_codon:yes gene_type:complete
LFDSKKQFYLNTPAGDLILTEIFYENQSVTILIGDKYRLDLDVDSALDLADSLLILTSEEGEKDVND